MAEKVFSINNQLAEIAVIADTLESLSDEWNIPMNITLSLNLVLEELVSNTILYGYDDTDEHKIEIHLSFIDEIVSIQIEDDGREFNPLLVAEVDVDLPIEERKIGGLGIHLVRKIMDEIVYERIDNKNILRLTKNIRRIE
ncbi:MAG: ATP-binding protein [Bacteroidales bacterium]|nr:ATP-binding protein [Bacteroidales bacterium]